MTQKQFYKSRAWRRARQAYIDERIAIDGGLCEVCGQELGLIVHHKVWLNDENCNDESISLNPKNFRYECQNCHNRERNPLYSAPGRCGWTESGELIRKSEY